MHPRLGPHTPKKMWAASKASREELPDLSAATTIVPAVWHQWPGTLVGHLCSLAAWCTTWNCSTKSIVGKSSSRPPPPPTRSHRTQNQGQPTTSAYIHPSMDRCRLLLVSFFFVQTVPYWNSLPPTVVNANSLTSFYSQVSNMHCH